jgi:hypothetical protein
MMKGRGGQGKGGARRGRKGREGEGRERREGRGGEGREGKGGMGWGEPPPPKTNPGYGPDKEHYIPLTSVNHNYWKHTFTFEKC